MNRIYSLVFNRALGQLQAVSEFASRPHGGASGRRRAVQVPPAGTCLALALSIAALPAFAQDHALPGGANIVGYTGVLDIGAIDDAAPGLLQITQDGRAVIQWDTFDIGAQAHVEFLQNSRDSIVVNHILDGDASRIDGRLSAGGGVYLINGHGIVFGGTAEVNAGRLMASTLEPDAVQPGQTWAESFLDMRGLVLSVQGGPSAIINRGRLTALPGGDIGLVGTHVLNAGGGVIDAPQGTISMVSAGRVAVDTTPGLSFLTQGLGTQTGAGFAHLVDNAGTLQARGGRISLESLAQAGLVALAVNTSGMIEATALGGRDGELRLTAAGGGAGVGGAIDVSGAATIGAQERVDLGGNLASGRLTLTGAAVRQTGGALDVSGTTTVNATGAVDLDRAGNAFHGRLSLAGGDVVVRSAGDLDLGPLGTDDLRIASGGGVRFGGGTVNGALEVGSAGDITQTAALTVTGTTRLDAGDHAIALAHPGNDFVGAVEAAGNGIALRDANDLTIAGIDNTPGAALSLTAGGHLSADGALNGGVVSLHGGAGLTLAHAVTGTISVALSSPAAIVQGAGAILTTPRLMLQAGSATLGGANVVGALGDVDVSGALVLTNTRDIVQADGATLTVGGTTALDAGDRAIALTNTDNDFGGAVDATGAGIALRDRNDLVVGSLANAADRDLSLVAGGDLVLSGGDIDTGAGAATLSAGGMLTTSGALRGGRIDLHGGAGLQLGHDVSAGGRLTLRSGDGIVQHGGALTAALLDVDAGGNVSLGANGNRIAALDNVSVAGDFELGNARSIVQTGTGALDIGGAMRLDAGDAGIVLENAGNRFGGDVHARAGSTIALRGRDTLRVVELDGGSGAEVRLAGDALDLATAVDAVFGRVELRAEQSALALSHALRGGGVFLHGHGGIVLGADVFAAGALELTSATGGIRQTGGAIAAGTAAIDAGSGDVDLRSAGNDFIGAVAVAGRDVTIRDTNALTLGQVDVERLDVAAGTIRIGQDIATSGDQNYRGAVTLTGDAALHSDAGGVAFASTVDGAHALAVTARDGAVTFGGAIGGAQRLAALTVDAGTMSAASGVAVTGALSIAVDDGDLVGHGPYLVGGTTTLATNGGRIDLIHGGNDFGGSVDIVDAGDVAIADANMLTFDNVTAASLDATAQGDLAFGTTTLAGALTARSAGGQIRHAGVATVGGATSLAAGSNITFDNAGNAFQGPIALSGANVRIQGRTALRFGSVEVGSLMATAPELWLAAAMDSTGYQLYAGNVYLAQNTRLTSVLGDIDIRGTVDGAHALGISAGGNVFLRGAIGGTTALTALDVDVSVGAPANASRLHLAGDVSTQGDQVYRGAVSLGADAALDSASGGIAFGSTVDGAHRLDATARGGAVTFAGAVGGSQRLAALSVDAQTFASGAIAVDDTLDIRIAQGDLVQGGAYLAGGDATFETGGGAIGLTQAQNRFGGAVRLSGGAATINTMDALTFGAVDVATLTATAAGALRFGGPLRTLGGLTATSAGAIGQDAALRVGGVATFDAGGQAITLTDADNVFDGQVNVRGGAVSLAAADALTVGTALVQALDATAHGGDLRFDGPVLVGGALDAQAGGSIGQGAAMEVGGAAHFRTAGGAITLDAPANRFLGAVHLDGGAVTIRNQPTLRLGAVDATRLEATAGTIRLGDGAIATTGDQAYRGAVVLGADSALTSREGDITFASTVDGAHALHATAAGTVAFDGDVGGTGALAALTVAGGRFLAAAGIAVDGGLDIAAAQGGIAQRGAYRVGGDARFDANGASIDLGRTDNALAGEVHLAGGAVTVRNGGDLRLGGVRARALSAHADGGLTFGRAVDVADSLVASAGGDIRQSAALAVGGGSTLTAAGRTIALDHRDNDFAGPVSVSAATVRLRDRDALTLGAVSAADMTVTAAGRLAFDGVADITGDLEANAGGGIAQTRALHVGGDAAFDAGRGAIDLTHAGNDFAGAVHLAGGVVAIRDRSALRLGRVDARSLAATAGAGLAFGDTAVVAGDLAVASAGDVSQAGALHVGGAATFDADGQAIVLGHADNAFAGPVHLDGRAATVRNRDALVLGEVAVDDALALHAGGGLFFTGPTRVGGDLSLLTEGGRIEQTHALRVDGRADIDAGSGDIALTVAGNAFGGPVRLAGGAVTVQTAGDLTVAGLVAARDRDVALTAGGDLVLPEAAIDIGGGAMSLSSGGRLATRGALRGGDVALRGGGITLAHDVTAGGALSLDSDGDIAQTGGRVSAARMTGRAGGDARFGGDNRIGVLDGFRARALDLHNATALRVAGPVDVTDGLRLSTASGDLALDGGLHARDVRLEIGGGISQSAAGRIRAGTLSGHATGPVRLGGADGFVDNRVATLGDFVAREGFSLTNGQTLTLASLNGSAFTVDAGTAAFYLSVDGDLLQQGTEWLYNGRGTWAATGGIGDPDAPIYVTAPDAQTVASIGRPPAYFNAIRPDGSPLPIGGPSVNLPTAVWAARAQSANQRTVGYVDVGADASNYRAYGLVEPGIRLPEDQQPECDPDFPEPDCVAAQ